MSSDNRHDISFAYATAPTAGQRLEIIPGLDWIRLPLPFALDHVNCWLLHDAKESCLIDTGANTPDTLGCWESIVANTGWPKTLLVTHYHPDHSGLAGWFSEQGAQVLTSEIEWRVVEELNAVNTHDYQQFYAQWYKQNGVPQSYIDVALRAGNTYKSITVPPPKHVQYLSIGSNVEIAGRAYVVMSGQGHSPDMLMLYCEAEKLLIAADQVLPSITPNVSLTPNTKDSNPLRSFLTCLERLRELPEETLVLPSHGLPFTGLHQRIDFLQEHHRLRLDEVAHALSQEQTASDLFSVLFRRKLDHQQMSFALGETLAHLRYLEEQGRVNSVDRDGVTYFRARK